MKDEEEIVLRIPAPLLERVREGCRQAGFEDMNDLLLYLLREVFEGQGKEMDKEELRSIERHLRGLGYV